MMIVAGDFTRDFNHPLERMIIARIRLSSKTIPGRHAIISNLAAGNVLFEHFEGRAQTPPEFIRGNGGQLRFRIVHVINVNALDAQVGQGLVQLILQVTWGHAMRATGNVCEAGDPRTDESFLDISPHVDRKGAIEREITAFRTNNNFIATKTAPSQFAQCRPD